jgi:hypothetical protein
MQGGCAVTAVGLTILFSQLEKDVCTNISVQCGVLNFAKLR